MVQVLRVMRASKLLARYDDRIGFSFVKMRIFKYLVLITTIAHWSACMFRLVASIESNDEAPNWITVYFGTEGEISLSLSLSSFLLLSLPGSVCNSAALCLFAFVLTH